jgi:hypothetical protein
MAISNIIISIWFVLAVVFVILIKIYEHSSKNYSKIGIQFLEAIISIMYGIIPVMLLVGIILSILGI